MFNSSLFPSNAGVSPPPSSHSVTSPVSSPSARAMSPPPMMSSFNSSPNFPPFLPRPPYSTNSSYQQNTPSFPKFEPNIGKYENSVTNQFDQKFIGLQSPYDSARISKFEPRFEPNLSTESSGLCQTSRSSSVQNSENSSLMVTNGQCSAVP